MIKLLIADQCSQLQEQLRHIQGLELVEFAQGDRPWPDQIQTHRPDITIVDLTTTPLVTQKHRYLPALDTTKVLMLGGNNDLASIEQAWSLGAKGYLGRDASTEELLQAILMINRGFLHFESTVLERLTLTHSTHPATVDIMDLDPMIVEGTPSSPQEENTLQEWSSLTKELVNTTPKVWTRGLLYFLLVFAAIALPWAMFSQVDETGVARGRLEPTGKTWQLDAPVAGTVKQVAVKEGDRVKAGQVLLSFDTELVARDLQQRQLEADRQQDQQRQLELLRHQLVLAINTQRQQNQSQHLEKQAQVQQANQAVDTARTDLELQSVEKLSPIDQAEAALAASRKNLTLAHQRNDQDQKEVERYRRLYRDGVIPEVQVVEKEQAAADSQRLLSQAQAEMDQATLRLAEAQRRYQTLIHQAQSSVAQSELRLVEQQEGLQGFNHAGDLAILKSEEELKNLESQLSDLKAEIAKTASQIKALQYQIDQHEVRSPVDGTLFTLPIPRSGAVVQPGTLLAEVSPSNGTMILRAQIATSESGSLQPGMAVKLKFDAYPYQDYGIFPGKVLKISPTSKQNNNTPGQLPTYDLEIEVEKTCIQTKATCTPLAPGQTATAEVIVRQRRIIDFIIDPFKQLQKGGLPL
jgi:HlyD family secretion protein